MSKLKTVPVAELQAEIGKIFGPTDWIRITQDQVTQFAEMTRDKSFIHTDPEAAAKTPLGGTVAHGALTLSFCAWFLSQAGVLPEGIQMGLNYGTDRVRFITPVKTGKRIRARLKPMSFTEKGPGKILMKYEITVEIEGEEKPALVAEQLVLAVLAN